MYVTILKKTFVATSVPSQPLIELFRLMNAVFISVKTPAWLEQMIAHTTWRDLFYKLAEAHPDCLMLNFTVKVKRNELKWVKDEVELVVIHVLFVYVVRSWFQMQDTKERSQVCPQPANSWRFSPESYERLSPHYWMAENRTWRKICLNSLWALQTLFEATGYVYDCILLIRSHPCVCFEQKMVCHGEHTYLFAQAMMSILAQEEQGGSAMRRIGQEVQKYAHERCICVAKVVWSSLMIF